ncbi:MAG: bifunctional 3-(3-hydroxy-phenyl)propionate/3-hydroxycinnamic acid hydroxylase [Pseudomonadota bacterium]
MDAPDILIVGLGPVGAVMASLCARQGLKVLAIERDLEIYKQPRAIVLDHEVMRLLNLIDCADGVLAHSIPSMGYHFVNQDWEVLMKRDPPPCDAPTGYPFANLFHQPSMERTVRAKLEHEPNVTVWLGAELQSLGQAETGVQAVIKTASEEREIKARYAVGCDGSRSMVRQTLGIELEDLGFDEPWVVVDALVPDGATDLPRQGVQMCDPERPTTCVPSGPGRRRWEFMLKHDDRAEDVVKFESLKSWIAKWTDPELIEIERSAVYQFHGLVAREWRKGRVLIIGDAAHQTPPFMGQGLCTGIRDAANLAWKLGCVVRGEAPETLLDTLQTERAPQTRAVIEGAIEMGRVVCVLDPDKAAERDRRMIADREGGRPFALPGVPRMTKGILETPGSGEVLPEGFVHGPGSRRRFDDVAGYRPLLIINHARFEGDLPESVYGVLSVGILGGERDGVTVIADEDGAIAELLGQAEALLARPDRIVFGTGDVKDLVERWGVYLETGRTEAIAPSKDEKAVA